MSAKLLVPGLALPSDDSSKVRLTAEEITVRMRTFLEAVAARRTYVFYSTVIEGFSVKQSRKADGIFYPDLNEIRAGALDGFNREDEAAGRPFVTSVVLEARTMLPRQPFFAALAKARGISIATEAERTAAHLREFEAARAYWTSNNR